MPVLFDKKENCCGCGLCAASCPKNAITMDSDGRFKYPSVEKEKCVSCGKCENICDFKNKKLKNSNTIKAYAAKATKDIRLNSSSGGVFTAISDKILFEGGIVFGADYDGNMTLIHKAAHTKEERDRMRIAKYVQSDISGVYSEIKKAVHNGTPVLFTGTPCQVAAVKKFIGSDIDNFFTADIICHGVPSAEVFAAFIKLLEKKYEKKIVSYSFRNKTVSWRKYSPVVSFSDGTQIGENDLTGSFIEVFRYELCLRPSCTDCRYTSAHREGDFTIGDFWGIEKHHPELDDGFGVSAVLLNTEKAIRFFKECPPELSLTECPPEMIAEGQINMNRSSALSPDSENFYKILSTDGIEKALKKYTRTGLKRRLKDTVKTVLKK